MPRILIVDNDEEYRSVIKEQLVGTYEVIDAGAPGAAFAMTREYKPDAILLDLSMPGLSDLELGEALSFLSVTEQVPIFIISGKDERNKDFCQNLGAYSYFTKPVDFPKLKEDLGWALGLQKTERRAAPRMNLKVMLKLSGTSELGVYWEARAATENISRSGFLCVCPSSLEEAQTVEVRLCGKHEYRLGRARLVRVVKSEHLSPRYGFQLIGSDRSPFGAE